MRNCLSWDFAACIFDIVLWPSDPAKSRSLLPRLVLLILTTSESSPSKALGLAEIRPIDSVFAKFIVSLYDVPVLPPVPYKVAPKLVLRPLGCGRCIFAKSCSYVVSISLRPAIARRLCFTPAVLKRLCWPPSSRIVRGHTCRSRCLPGSSSGCKWWRGNRGAASNRRS